MLDLKLTSAYKHDLRMCHKRGLDIHLLEEIVEVLRIPAKPDDRYHDHGLVGNKAGYRECHITPDWLLVYRYVDGLLELVRTGSHSDIFR